MNSHTAMFANTTEHMQIFAIKHTCEDKTDAEERAHLNTQKLYRPYVHYHVQVRGERAVNENAILFVNLLLTAVRGASGRHTANTGLGNY